MPRIIIFRSGEDEGSPAYTVYSTNGTGIAPLLFQESIGCLGVYWRHYLGREDFTGHRARIEALNEGESYSVTHD